MTSISPPNRRKNGQWAAFRTVLPLLWPKDAPAMRVRVAAAMGCLILAKLANLHEDGVAARAWVNRTGR